MQSHLQTCLTLFAMPEHLLKYIKKNSNRDSLGKIDNMFASNRTVRKPRALILNTIKSEENAVIFS